MVGLLVTSNPAALNYEEGLATRLFALYPGDRFTLFAVGMKIVGCHIFRTPPPPPCACQGWAIGVTCSTSTTRLKSLLPHIFTHEKATKTFMINCIPIFLGCQDLDDCECSCWAVELRGNAGSHQSKTIVQCIILTVLNIWQNEKKK